MDENVSAVVRRHARTLRILTCLQSGPGFSASELARHLNVSRRTIFRDLNLIRAAGVQVFFDEDHEAYRLSAPGRCPAPPGFHEEDLAQLVVAARLSPLQHFAQFSITLRESLAKLLSGYPYRVSVSMSRLLHACALSEPATAFPAGAEEVMDAVFYAIRNRRQIRIVVHSVGEGMTQTKFSPYRVLASFDEWQVMGRSSFHRSTRSFPLRSIQSAEKTNDPYGVPRGFRFRQ